MAAKPLSLRLAAAAVAWVGVALLVVGVLLVVLFRAHIERRFDAQLRDHLQELAAVSEVTADGRLWMTWTPSDPRMQRPLSGWYWQIMQGDRVVARSASLWRERLPLSALASTRPGRIVEILGPGKAELRALAHRITLPESAEPYTYIVAGPAREVDEDISRFAWQVAVTLAALGVSLIGAVIVQIRFGLKPLAWIESAIAAVRTGRAQRLPTDYPVELMALVDEVNRLLDHNEELLARARATASNLAHGLRNPLAVIRNEATRAPGELGQILVAKADAMGRAIDRQLAHARVAGRRRVLGARTAVAPVVEDLRFSLAILHRERGVRITAEAFDGQDFQGESEDLEEMLGNLMDNACKWAKNEVRVRGERRDGRLLIRVEDDGPGVPRERRGEVLERGRRLDETVPGTGLGLAIVADIVEAYGGELKLDESSAGGLVAELDLPSAPADS